MTNLLQESAESKSAVQYAIDKEMRDVTFIRRAAKEHRCNGGHNGVCRVPCDKPILNGSLYVEYVGDSAPFESGHHYHFECAAQQGLVVASFEINLATPAPPAEVASAPPAPSGNLNAGAALGESITEREERPSPRIADTVASEEGSAVQGSPDSTPPRHPSACCPCGSANIRIRRIGATGEPTRCLDCGNEDFIPVIGFPTSPSRGATTPACSQTPPVVDDVDEPTILRLARSTAPSVSLSADTAAPGRTQDASGAGRGKGPVAFSQDEMARAEQIIATHAIANARAFDPLAGVRSMSIDRLALIAVEAACDAIRAKEDGVVWRENKVYVYGYYLQQFGLEISVRGGAR